MKKIICSFILFVCAASLPIATVAKELVLTTSIGVEAFHDDQYRIQIDDTDTAGIIYRPDMELSYEGARVRTGFTAGATYNEFENSNFGRTENLNLGWDIERTSEKSSLSLDTDYSEELLSDLVEFDDAPGASTNETVKEFSVSTGYNRQLSRRASLELGYTYYQNEIEGSALGDDKNARHSVVIGWSRMLSERSTFGLYADYTAFRPDDQSEQGLDSDSYGLSVGGDYQLSGRWSLRGSVGASQLSTDEDDLNTAGVPIIVEDGDVVLTSDLAATYSGQRNGFNIGLSAGTTQQLDGVVDNQQELGVGWTRQISEAWNSAVNFRYLQADRNDRENYIVDARLNWQASPRWNYSFAYAYREQQSTNSVLLERLSGTSNRFVVTVQYTFEDLRFDI